MHPLTALYVEDRPINVVLMKAIFHRCPQFRLVTATSCWQALQIAAHHEPALLMLDLDLPDGHGAALLQQLRLMAGYADVPAVAVTADQHFSIAGTGFSELWPKPLDLPLVFKRLASVAATGTLFGAPDAHGLAAPPPDAARTRGAAAYVAAAW